PTGSRERHTGDRRREGVGRRELARAEPARDTGGRPSYRAVVGCDQCSKLSGFNIARGLSIGHSRMNEEDTPSRGDTHLAGLARIESYVAMAVRILRSRTPRRTEKPGLPLRRMSFEVVQGTCGFLECLPHQSDAGISHAILTGRPHRDRPWVWPTPAQQS